MKTRCLTSPLPHPLHTTFAIDTNSFVGQSATQVTRQAQSITVIHNRAKWTVNIMSQQDKVVKCCHIEFMITEKPQKKN